LDRPSLASLYLEESLLTANTAELVGAGAIVEYFCSEGLAQIRKVSQNVSVQPTMGGDVLLVVSQGVMLMTFEEENELPYVDAFVLVSPSGDGESWFIANHIQSSHGS
jgi:hypothetical protein